MTRVVHLHIGAPKTGTTYLQDRLARNTTTLARHGVHYPGLRWGDPSSLHFRAALDLLGQDWGGPPGHAEGAWPAMVRRVRRLDGNVVVSHEILAPAPAEAVDRALRDLRDAEVHVVYAVRDLARQLPAAWQESIKQGRKWSFRRFLDSAEKGGAWFARAFDLPSVLATWGRALPPDRLHVVTVPQRGTADPDLLWRRLCRALDIDPAWAPLDSERVNRSLGVVETEVIRRLNRRVGRRIRRDGQDNGQYDDLVLRVLAQNQLAVRRSPRVTLPPDRYDWVEEQTGVWLSWLTSHGVDIVGDLADLQPRRPPPGAAWADPDAVSRKRLLRATLDALEVMTREAAGRQDPLVRRVQRRLGAAARPGGRWEALLGGPDTGPTWPGGGRGER